MYRSHVLVCGGTGCTSANSPAIIEALEAQIAEKGLTDEVKVVQTGCHGLLRTRPDHDRLTRRAAFYSEVKV